MTDYPVAMIPYANMAPFRVAGTPKGCRWIPLVPSESVVAINAGKVLAAAIPVGAMPALGSRIEPIGRFGIAAKEASMSVLLFSHRPIRHLSPGDRISATKESTTSVRLLEMLLHRPFTGNRQWAPSSPLATSDAELMIGDRALAGLYWRQREGDRFGEAPRLAAFAHVTDLASEWFDWQGVPFVFARWVVRTDAPADCRQAIKEWLLRFRDGEPAFVRRSIPKASADTGLPTELIERYFAVIRRTLTEKDMAGQKRFLDNITQAPSLLRQSLRQPPATAALG
ncbi:MAG: hypothetical protein PVH30_00785 [Desulfobacterales bacterium]|jgi:predicted solute-binding protein